MLNRTPAARGYGALLSGLGRLLDPRRSGIATRMRSSTTGFAGAVRRGGDIHGTMACADIEGGIRSSVAVGPTIRRLRWLVATVLIAFAVSAGWTSAQAMACPKMQFIGVRGSGEHSGFGHTVGSVLSHVNAQAGVGNQTIDYWAVNVNPWEPKYFFNYMTSVKQGVENLDDAVTSFRTACGTTPMILAGYSQGAEVIDHWLSSGPSLANVVGVALFGDPRFSPNNGAPIDQGSYNRSLFGVSHTFFPHIGMFGGVERYSASRQPWLRSYCANHDQICNTSSLAALAGCGIGSNCAHFHYAEAMLGGGTYTQDAADFLVARAQAAIHTPTSGGGSPPGGGQPNPGGPSGAGTPPPGGGSPPAPTYAETTGGVTHTWTNYSNAGGTQGPSIPSNSTVQIACKVTGFAVADGDTWWYQIASSPWNSAYYASADAFYNNGQTSGSLIGTPFVDPAVPDC
jgi:Cutinase